MVCFSKVMMQQVLTEKNYDKQMDNDKLLYGLYSVLRANGEEQCCV